MFYHGTTLENARHLLSGGEKSNPVWNCSYDDYLYVWWDEAVKEEHDLEDSEVEEFTIRMAFESAAITAASSQTAQSEIIVLAFDFPEADVYEDVSCENMACARRVNLDLDATDLENSLIKLYSAKHNSRFDPFILVGLWDNDYFLKENVSSDVREVLDALKGTDFYLDELFEYDWREINKNKVLTSGELSV